MFYLLLSIENVRKLREVVLVPQGSFHGCPASLLTFLGCGFSSLAGLSQTPLCMHIGRVLLKKDAFWVLHQHFRCALSHDVICICYALSCLDPNCGAMVKVFIN